VFGLLYLLYPIVVGLSLHGVKNNYSKSTLLAD
jgi:hypothetical protein